VHAWNSSTDKARTLQYRRSAPVVADITPYEKWVRCYYSFSRFIKREVTFMTCNTTLEFKVTDDSPAAIGLSGAEFTVTDPDGNAVGTAASDADGNVSLNLSLTPGLFYAMSQTATPAYHRGTQIAGEIYVDCNCKATVDGIAFELFASVVNPAMRCQKTVEFIVADENGRPLAGAVFALLTPDGAVQRYAVSDASGQVSLDMDLLVGKSYTLTETASAATAPARPPANHEAMADCEVIASCKGTAGCTDCTVSIGGTDADSFKAVSNPVSVCNTQLSFIVRDEAGNALSGAYFTVTDPNGDPVARATSGQKGDVSLSLELKIGSSYTLREIRAPALHEPIPDATLTVDCGCLESCACNILVNGERAPKAVLNPSVTCSGYLNFTVVDDLGTPLALATFTVTDPDGNVIASATSDSAGNVALAVDLKAGYDYTLSETIAPAQHQKMTDKTVHLLCTARDAASYPGCGCDILVDEEYSYNFTTVVNARQLCVASLNFTVTDDAGMPLGGAEFTLLSSSGTALAVGASDQSGNVSLTGADLTAGLYTLTETAAPAGYEPMADANVLVDCGCGDDCACRVTVNGIASDHFDLVVNPKIQTAKALEGL